MKVLIEVNQKLYSLSRYSIFKSRKYNGLYGRFGRFRKNNIFLNNSCKNHHRNLKISLEVLKKLVKKSMGTDWARFSKIWAKNGKGPPKD